MFHETNNPWPVSGWRVVYYLETVCVFVCLSVSGLFNYILQTHRVLTSTRLGTGGWGWGVWGGGPNKRSFAQSKIFIFFSFFFILYWFKKWITLVYFVSSVAWGKKLGDKYRKRIACLHVLRACFSSSGFSICTVLTESCPCGRTAINISNVSFRISDLCCFEMVLIAKFFYLYV